MDFIAAAADDDEKDIIALIAVISVLDLSGVGGLTPLWCLSTPKFLLILEKIVKISKKYIADPSLVFPQIEY